MSSNSPVTATSQAPVKASGSRVIWGPPMITGTPRARNSRAISMARRACETLALMPTKSNGVSKSTGAMASSCRRTLIPTGAMAATVAMAFGATRVRAPVSEPLIPAKSASQ